jgi:hypothetical protein
MPLEQLMTTPPLLVHGKLLQDLQPDSGKGEEEEEEEEEVVAMVS